MDLRHVRTFVTVAELGTVSSAAVRLHTAQPALSRQIGDLERRSRRGASPESDDLHGSAGAGVAVAPAVLLAKMR